MRKSISGLMTILVFLGVLSTTLRGQDNAAREVRAGDRLLRTGDEIMVCGQLFHTTTPVVLWVDRKDTMPIELSVDSAPGKGPPGRSRKRKIRL